MRDSRFAAAVLLLAGLVVFAAMAVVRVDGVFAEGGGSLDYAGTPATLLSVTGHRSGGDTHGTVALYHVLVTFPGDSATSVTFTAGSSYFRPVASQVWRVWNGGGAAVVSLDTWYDPLLRRVHVAGTSFPIRRGNLFVARYDRYGRAHVRQLPRNVSQINSLEVTRTFQDLLPGDPLVRGLLGAPASPCPHPATSTPRGAAT
jgi:hypothetical protein